jgi:hypothetical protein
MIPRKRQLDDGPHKSGNAKLRGSSRCCANTNLPAFRVSRFHRTHRDVSRISRAVSGFRLTPLGVLHTRRSGCGLTLRNSTTSQDV